jgi:hypothetical protein
MPAVSADPAAVPTIPALVRPGIAAHLVDHHPATSIDRNWTALAVQRLEADSRRSADTHLMKLPWPGPVDLYLKDESTHPTGSLKLRLARSLFLYALWNEWIFITNRSGLNQLWSGALARRPPGSCSMRSPETRRAGLARSAIRSGRL